MKQNTNDDKAAGKSAYVDDQLLHKTFDNMLEGVQIIGFDWRYIYVNDAMARHGKYSRDEFVGHTVMEKYPGIEQTGIYSAYTRCFNERVAVHMENRFVFPDGSIGWFELSFQPIPDGLFILSIDITERKKNEESIRKLNEELEEKVARRTAQLEEKVKQLKDSETKFQKAFQASAAGIAITRIADAVYMNVNDAFVEMTGYTNDELVGHTSVELGLIHDIKKREAVLQQVVEHGSAKNFELTIRTRSGKLIDILSSVETIELNGERLAINIIYDITERKRAEEQLASMNKDLEAFTFMVSHDLRAPLRAIEGYAGMLEHSHQKTNDEKTLKLLARIQHNTQKMSALIDGLLTFSRSGKEVVTRSQLDMNELVRSSLEDLVSVIKDDIGITVGKLHPAFGDPVLIRQVLINLISNAVKYSSKKPKPVVEITSQDTGKTITYSVKDNGEGFDMKYAGKLFNPFQRLHSQDDFEGTGIGLAMVHRIIARHGGTIWALATPGEGATFSFALPKN